MNCSKCAPFALIVVMALSADAHGATVAVNTATDDFGSVTSNCSLREAIQSTNTNANFGGCIASGSYNTGSVRDPDIITLPTLVSGGFTLGRVGNDDSNVAGDLDIDGDLHIIGVSAANSVIRGNTSAPDFDRHRLMQIHEGTVLLVDLTLRDGLENDITAGGGLRTEFGTATVLNRVTVTNNTTDGNAGGILNGGTMSLNDSVVSFNQTIRSDDGGGGIFVESGRSLTLNNSRVLNNTVNAGNIGIAQGGGIHGALNSELILNNSVVDGNVAEGARTATSREAFGGGIYSEGSVTLVQSSITNNKATGSFGFGGGVFAEGFLLVDRSVVSNNIARTDRVTGGSNGGGGIDASVNNTVPVIQDSVISGNQNLPFGNDRGSGAGLNGDFRILRTTVANNRGAQSGGGLSTGLSTIINSTFIGNEAADGGGISIGGIFPENSHIYSSTIVANSATGGGGGIRIDGAVVVNMRHSVLAGNSAGGGGPDCLGNITSLGQNLVQTSTACELSSFSSDQFDIPAGLAPATNNGGLIAGSSLGIVSGMLTRAPLSTSPLIDSGFGGGSGGDLCFDELDVALTTDQLGNERAIDGPDFDTNARCDIGAVEFVEELFANQFE